MKRVLLISCLIGSVLGLGACQNMAQHSSHGAPCESWGSSLETAVRQSIAVDRSMVYSYHFGHGRACSRIC